MTENDCVIHTRVCCDRVCGSRCLNWEGTCWAGGWGGKQEGASLGAENMLLLLIVIVFLGFFLLFFLTCVCNYYVALVATTKY